MIKMIIYALWKMLNYIETMVALFKYEGRKKEQHH